GQVGLAGKTRTVRAQEEVRDFTWDALPQKAVAAKFEPTTPGSEELQKRAVLAWVRNLAKALAASPPEAVDVSDEKGCVAYGLSLNLTSAIRGRQRTEREIPPRSRPAKSCSASLPEQGSPCHEQGTQHEHDHGKRLAPAGAG